MAVTEAVRVISRVIDCDDFLGTPSIDGLLRWNGSYFVADTTTDDFVSATNPVIGSLNGILKASSGTVSGSATTDNLLWIWNNYYIRFNIIRWLIIR